MHPYLLSWHGILVQLKSILKLDRLRLRGPTGPTDKFTWAGIAQNLRRMAKLVSQGPPFDRLGVRT